MTAETTPANRIFSVWSPAAVVPWPSFIPASRGVAGAQKAGASLVSFNASAFCSYEHEQGANAPTSEYAAFAYATALNTLLADRDHVCRVGDTTIVLWAEGGDTAYQDCALFTLFGGMGTEAPLLSGKRSFERSETVGQRPCHRLGRKPVGPQYPVLCSGACPQCRTFVGPLFLAEQLRTAGPKSRRSL